jgi:hypothetical protein
MAPKFREDIYFNLKIIEKRERERWGGWVEDEGR